MVKSAFFLVASAIATGVTANTSPASVLAKREDNVSTQTWKKPKVNFKKLQASIKEKNLAKKARELENAAYSTPDRNRVFSSQGHLNTLELIEKYLDTVSDHYTYGRQEFTALYSQASGNFSADTTAYKPVIFQYSPSGSLSGTLIPVENLGCEAADYPAEVEGNIALISRGTCEFGLKSALAGAAGAKAAVIYNNVAGAISGGTLGPPPREEGDYVPSVGITRENGTALLGVINGGKEVVGTIQVNSIIENRTTYNLIAETKGGNKNQVVALGGHTDSVFAGPGINDDGSGTIGILEVALQLAKYSTKNAVRFGWWSAEEFGLLGSDFYVESLTATERDKIKLYLNFDMIASPNYVNFLYDGDGSAFNNSGPAGSAEIEKFFEDWFADQGLPTAPTNFDGRSDYAAFNDAGIPTGGIFTGAEGVKTEEEAALFGGEAGVAYDVNYHKAGDNYTNLNFDAFVTNTRGIAAAVAYYATDLSSLPVRNSTSGLRKRGNHFHPHAKRTKALNVHMEHDCGAAPKMWI